MTWDLAISGEPPPPSTESRFITASAAHKPPSPEWRGRVCRSAWSTKITQLAAPVRVLLRSGLTALLPLNIAIKRVGEAVWDGWGVGDGVVWETV